MFIIERAKLSDAKSLAELYWDAYSENEKLGLPASASSVSVQEVEQWINNTILFVAKQPNPPIIMGTVRLKFNEDWNCFVLSRLAVKSELKGQGLSKQLMKAAEKALADRKENVIRLTVAQKHPYLPTMYKRRGYNIVGERNLNDLSYNEFIMEKVLC
ncbi:GNAT family N-acetyltransferase [Sporosarcina sp. NCCP-2222]|uniref:GNAT family N-acetyltransferase n=1 Tax=Sporosarcina sp. NCCP-2222 TaxID=2935073 RepID=UPI0020BFF099|nr:GNAT family N-acetyltransferase [Sporosarcina sp. NCCP-2222]